MKTFWDKCKPIESGCWEWQGGRTKGVGKSFSYGRTLVNKKKMLAHRYAWTLKFGPVPEGMMVCHKCDNPPCCNPSHLFLGTGKDNTQDALKKGRLFKPPNPNANKTHCKNGHPLSGDNIWINKRTGQRQCKECHKIVANRWYAKRSKDPEFRKLKSQLASKYYREKRKNSQPV